MSSGRDAVDDAADEVRLRSMPPIERSVEDR
jgi:hypothetical protein